jgi:hypothetical protein
MIGVRVRTIALRLPPQFGEKLELMFNILYHKNTKPYKFQLPTVFVGLMFKMSAHRIVKPYKKSKTHM